MKPEICALNLVTLDFIYSGIHRLPGLGEEVSTNHLTLSLGGGPIASLITAARLGQQSGWLLALDEIALVVLPGIF